MKHEEPLFDDRVRKIAFAITVGRHAEYAKQPPEAVWDEALAALEGLLPSDEFRPDGVRTDCPKTRALAEVVLEGLTIMRADDEDDDDWQLPDLVTINRAMAKLAALVQRAEEADRFRAALKRIAAEPGASPAVQAFAARVVAGEPRRARSRSKRRDGAAHGGVDVGAARGPVRPVER